MKRPEKIAKDVLPYVEYLEGLIKSPFFNSYIACKTTTDRWNNQLIANEIDLFNPEDKAKFDMAHKYLTEQKPYLEQLEYLLSKMTPEEKDEAEKKLISEAGSAEHLALKHLKNGTAK